MGENRSHEIFKIDKGANQRLPYCTGFESFVCANAGNSKRQKWGKNAEPRPISRYYKLQSYHYEPIESKKYN